MPFSFPVFVIYKSDSEGKKKGRAVVDICKFNELYREIISRPNPLSGSGFHSIHPNPFQSAPNLPPSAPTGSTFDQI